MNEKDIDKMSEAELDAHLAKQKPSAEQEIDNMSEEDLDNLLDLHGKLSQQDSMIAKGLEYAGSGLSAVGAALDYPMAPVREAVGSTIDVVKGDKTIPQAGASVVTPLISGPSTARTWSQILEQLGVPRESNLPAAGPMGIETLMSEEELANTPKFQASAVGGALLDQLQPNLMSKIPIPKIINRQKQGERALGMGARAIEEGLNTPYESTRNLENVVDTAKETGILRPLSSTEGIVDRAKAVQDKAGKKIGRIINENGSQIDEWINNVSPAEREAYFNSGFNIQNQGPKMLMELSDQLEGGGKHDQAVKILANWLEKHDVPMKGRPDIETLQKWKKNVSDTINFSKKEKKAATQLAYEKILEYVDAGIEGEVNFANKFLKGPALKEYQEAKKQYSIAKNISQTSGKKFGSERANSKAAGNIMEFFTKPIYGTKMQSTLATLPENVIPRGPMATNIRSGVQGFTQANEEGYIPSPMMSPQDMELRVRADKKLSPTERARVLNEIRRGQ